MHARLAIVLALVTLHAVAAGCNGNAATGTTTSQPVAMAGQPNVEFPSPPLFITPPRLGFHVGVGVPYDIVFAYDNFYLYYGTSWYRAPSYAGPWTIVQYDSLPPIIRAQRIENIRKYRDQEYRLYRRSPNHYRGRQFRPGKR
ncbi:hypothetical protein [Geobacter sp. AOG2]|uniref:hypothetical protein n=1 Tax=Geobacter sp. AOG2 TaxID=1566347 RepID=UPI001CC5FF0B|nr:hypothetical protein [Geobacter sp. AOG2]GFE59756.1 hypothetical protein AOG2_03440 [Geobacter sp. AOG2]